jgi:hypothetical protein
VCLARRRRRFSLFPSTVRSAHLFFKYRVKKNMEKKKEAAAVV